MTAEEPPPRYCVHCAYDTQGSDPLVEPLSAPHIATTIGKATDAIYRAEEEGSNFRADMAREMGLDKEAADSLRITNMNDRKGEAAVVPIVNPVSQFMDAHPAAAGFSAGAANYQGYSEAARTGIYPNAGAKARHDLREAHVRFLNGSGHKGPVTSDVPALETQQPGYMPRVRTI